jgi:hypothetical protein
MRLVHSLSTGNHCQVASNFFSPPAEPGVYHTEITVSTPQWLLRTRSCEHKEGINPDRGGRPFSPSPASRAPIEILL